VELFFFVFAAVALLFEAVSTFLPSPSLRTVRQINSPSSALWWQIGLAIPPFLAGLAGIGLGLELIPSIKGPVYLAIGAALGLWAGYIILESSKRLSLRRKLSRLKGGIAK